jgi:hypothetical protein
MRYESKELTRIYEYLSKRGIATSEDELLRVILEFAAEKEDELSLMLKRKEIRRNLKEMAGEPGRNRSNRFIE